MVDPNTQSWRTVRGQKPLNEARVAMYERLMEAEQRVAEACRRRGVSPARIADALEASQPNPTGTEEDDGDVYLATLVRYVAALGGHVEVSAVFPEETFTVLCEPDEPSPPAA